MTSSPRNALRVGALLSLGAFTLGCGASTWPTPAVQLDLRVPAIVQHHGAGIHVHIETTDPLELKKRGDDGEWHSVCSAPCDTTSLEPGEYEVVRSDWELVVTNPFRIDVPEGTTGVLRVGPTAPAPTHFNFFGGGGSWL